VRDLFDLPSYGADAPMRRSKAPEAFEATTPCPVRVRGKRCNRPVEAIDPMRTCGRCRASGAPTRVSWELAKPDHSATVLPEFVLELANAGLSEMAVHAPSAPKEEVGSFTVSIEKAPAAPVPIGTFPCGHPRFFKHGFCGPCNPPRL
jgi:hypothetical protein